MTCAFFFLPEYRDGEIIVRFGSFGTRVKLKF
jgi:hypothetical protein